MEDYKVLLGESNVGISTPSGKMRLSCAIKLPYEHVIDLGLRPIDDSAVAELHFGINVQVVPNKRGEIPE